MEVHVGHSIQLSQSWLSVSWEIFVMMVRRIGSGAESEVMAEITAQMLMHMDVMSLMFVMEPMRAIPVLILVLCESSTSIPSLLREFRSLEHCSSTSKRFLWGRKADGSTALASL